MHAGAIVTHFNCTEGPLCAGDIVECNCSTSSGTLEWNVSERADNNETWTLLFNVTFHRVSETTKTRNGYNAVFNKTLNASTLNFTLNQSEAILIECADANETDKKNDTITDSG